MTKDSNEIINGKWPITDERRAAIVKSLVKIVTDSASTSAEKTAASRALIAIEALNQAAERANEKW